MKKLVTMALILPLLLSSWLVPINAQETSQINEEIIYNIFVDRFNNGDRSLDEQVDVDDPNAYHGGDIQGIINKLDYIKELGFTTISLSSIFENSPDGYHGYWIEDFFKVEEQFGTLEDLQTLVKEAHKRDIKVLLEFVPNYVSADHPIAENPSKSSPTTVSDTLWLDRTVTLNHQNTEVKENLLDAAAYWLNETDIDGYRIHAVDQTPVFFLQALVDHLKQVKPDIYLTGSVLNEKDLTKEHTNIDIPLIEYASIKDSMVNVLTEVGTPVEDIFQQWKESGEQTGLLYVDNKFTERFTRKIVKNGLNPQTTWKLALTYMYTTPGVPVIYQGSAIPMDGATPEEVQQLVQFNNSDPDLQDFFNKIASIRTQFPVLSHGDFDLVDSNGAMSVFKRSNEDTTMFIAINNGTETKSVTVDDVPAGSQLSGLLGDNIVRENENGKYKIGIDRESVEIYVIEQDKGLNWMFIGMVVGVFLIFALAVGYLSFKQRRRSH